jgi:type III pantothenate kinase
MNLALDFGNTRIKAGLFEGNRLSTRALFSDTKELRDFLSTNTFANAIVSSVSMEVQQALDWINVSGMKLPLTSTMDLPVTIAYGTPGTLGVDRIAAVCGARAIYPGRDCLVIDAGTCITYEFLSASGVYEGGAISPGIRMRFEAMNHFTARLPLVKPLSNAPLTGKTTEQSMQSGVMNGLEEEIKGIISRYQQEFPHIQIILCGGDSVFFENTAKRSIFVAPDLVLTGLNAILLHYVNR